MDSKNGCNRLLLGGIVINLKIIYSLDYDGGSGNDKPFLVVRKHSPNNDFSHFLHVLLRLRLQKIQRQLIRIFCMCFYVFVCINFRDSILLKRS